jgi:hypothetical protein
MKNYSGSDLMLNNANDCENGTSTNPVIGTENSRYVAENKNYNNFIQYLEIKRHLEHAEKKTPPRKVDIAFERISTFVDELNLHGYSIEIENLFDDWKLSIIDLISDKKENSSIEHSQILGMISSVVRKKDLNLFELKDLNAIRDTTYLLRNPRLNKSHVKQCTDKIGHLYNPSPLETNNLSDKEETDLHQMMANILAQIKSA